MTYLMVMMSTLLVAFLVMSTSANQRYGRPSASENDREEFIFDLDEDDDDQEIMKEQLVVDEINIELLLAGAIQGYSNGKSIEKQGRRTTSKLPRKPIITTKKPPYTGCGTSIHHGKIVGGHKVDEAGKFPWMVATLWNAYSDGWKPGCGGAIISNRHILTAAHCIETWYKPSDVMVRLGESNMNNSQASPSRRDIAVSKIFVHEGYDEKTEVNDIAILQLTEIIVSNDKIRPICLPTAASSLNLGGRMATVAGWGDTTPGSEEGSQFLMEVDLPLVEFSQCKKSYDAYYDYYDYAISERKPVVKEHICAGYPDGEKDSCQGDSGGPLMFQADHTKPWTVIGVTSWGAGCAQKGPPGVYARVHSYHDWIQSKMAIK